MKTKVTLEKTKENGFNFKLTVITNGVTQTYYFYDATEAFERYNHEIEKRDK